MLSKIGASLWISYKLLLILAAGGLIGANIFGLIYGVYEFANSSERAPQNDHIFQWWVHGGWLIGAGVSLVGEIVRNRRTTKRISDELSGLSIDSKTSWSHRKTNQRRMSVHRKSRSQSGGILSTIGFGSIFGGIIGFLLGCSFLLLWISITYSPFALNDWVSSLSVEKRKEIGSGRDEYLITAGHPVAFYVFSAPIILGITAGGLIGGVTATTEKMKGKKES